MEKDTKPNENAFETKVETKVETKKEDVTQPKSKKHKKKGKPERKDIYWIEIEGKARGDASSTCIQVFP